MKRAMRFIILALTMAILGLAGGCAWSIGHPDHAQPTRGQELVDLKKARDQGAITEEEYQKEKKRVLGE